MRNAGVRTEVGLLRGCTDGGAHRAYELISYTLDSLECPKKVFSSHTLHCQALPNVHHDTRTSAAALRRPGVGEASASPDRRPRRAQPADHSSGCLSALREGTKDRDQGLHRMASQNGRAGAGGVGVEGVALS